MSILYLRSENDFYEHAENILSKSNLEQIRCAFKTAALLLLPEVSKEAAKYYEKLEKGIASAKESVKYLFPKQRTLEKLATSTDIEKAKQHIENAEKFYLEGKVILKCVDSEDFPSMMLGNTSGVLIFKNTDTRAVNLVTILKGVDLKTFQKYYEEIFESAEKINFDVLKNTLKNKIN